MRAPGDVQWETFIAERGVNLYPGHGTTVANLYTYPRVLVQRLGQSSHPLTALAVHGHMTDLIAGKRCTGPVYRAYCVCTYLKVSGLHPYPYPTHT